MDSKSTLVNNLVKNYRALVEVPTITSGQVINKNADVIKISSVWSQRNIELGEMTKFQKDFVVKASSSEILFESQPTDISSQEMSKSSPSGKFHCVVRKTKQDNKKKQFLEIWDQDGLWKNFDISALDVHGDIYADGEFGTLEWSPNEDKILYVAEKKTKKLEPFYKQKPTSGSNGDGGEAPLLGEEYTYKQDWGEQLVDKHQPVVAICDVKAEAPEALKVLNGVPANFSPGQLIWSKDGNGIYGMALENEPRRLGLIYCTNRPGFIFHLSLKGEFKILSEKAKSVRSPRLSPDGKSLYWLQRPAGGVHGGCQQLVKLDLAPNTKKIIIDIVRVGNKTFSGLFLHTLPARCFSKDGTKLFFSSCNRSKTSSYYVDIGSKQVHLLETGEGSATILDVHDDVVLISSGTLQKTPALKISKAITKFDWIPITKSKVLYKDSVLKEMDLEATAGNPKFSYYNALYYGPPAPKGANQKVPLVVYPHGGPHSALVDDFAFIPNFLVANGYGVLLVNYRGSTGAGQDGVDFLPGKIGDADVKDTHEAVLHAMKSIPYLDPKNVFLHGFSHGGYLVCHMSAQYPDFYRAVVSGNPVTDVYGMYVMSDIPDWATGECHIPFDETKPLTSDQVNKLLAASPVQIANKVKAPTLLLIGKKDLRVPAPGGMKYYHALKARNVKVRMNVYEDNHSLSIVPIHLDWMINAAVWYAEHKA